MYEQFYKILEIPNGSDKALVKEAYRKLAKKYHPDLNSDPSALKKFLAVNEAYEVLIKGKLNYRRKRGNKSHATPYQGRRRPGKTDGSNPYQSANWRKRRKPKPKTESLLLFEFIQLSFNLLIGVSLFLLPFVVGIMFGIKFFFFTLIVAFFGAFVLLDFANKKHRYIELIHRFFNMERWNKKFKAPFENVFCNFSDSTDADMQAMRVNMVKVKDIKLKNSGVLQHQVQYVRDYKSVRLSRSKKAYFAHIHSTLIKLFSIVLSLVFIKSNSIIFEVFVGSLLGSIIAAAYLYIIKVRSRIYYFINYMFLSKLVFMLLLTFFCVDYHSEYGFVAYYSYQIGFTLFLFLDSFLESLLKLIPNNLFYRPILKHNKTFDELIDKGYLFYINMPVWSVVYPYFKWIVW